MNVLPGRLPSLIADIRLLAGARHQCDFAELERAIITLEHELHAVLQHCHHRPDTRPASIPVTASHEGAPMATYTPGTPVDFTADVKNAELQDITDQVTWSTTAGTLTPDADNPLVAHLTDAPLGDVTVTATTSNGIPASDTATFADQTPASISLTDAAAPTAA